MNSREKGKRGERQWRDVLRAEGFQARRGQQFAGGADSPDVVCPALPWAHFEVKCVERLNIEDAMEQARRDAAGQIRKQKFESRNGDCQTKVPFVAHKRSHRQWLVTMDAETFFRLLRGDFVLTADGTDKRGFVTEGNEENEGEQSLVTSAATGNGTTQPQGVDSIRPPTTAKDASGLPGQRARRTDPVTAPTPGDVTQATDRTVTLIADSQSATPK